MKLSKLSSKERREHRKYLWKRKNQLYSIYCKKDNPFSEENKEHIDYVIDNVLSEQLLRDNQAELNALQILSNKGITPKYQEPIPILGEGGKLEHLYIADILINNIIIEIDGEYHNTERKKQKDFIRDQETSKRGYITKRYLSSEIDKLKEESFI